MKKGKFLILLALAGCGPSRNSNPSLETDMVASHSTVHPTDEGLPGGGLAVRVTNALQWPTGAEGEPTICHLRIHLCGSCYADSTEIAENDAPVGPSCTPLGIVNAGRTVLFHVNAATVSSLLQPSCRSLQLKALSSCQTSTYLSVAGPSFLIDKNLEGERQDVAITLEQAHWSGYTGKQVSF